jgi:NADH-quinone oxidoreductase subunit G
MVGRYDSRFAENKVTKHKKATPIGPWVMLDQERCILCSRCVRFTREISKTHEMAIFQRGDHAEIDVFPGRQIDNPYSANVIDICPVGALTCRDFRFQCRVWYLKRTPSVCPGCARGCAIEIHHNPQRPQKGRGRRIFRLKPRYNPEVNRWWLCDAGRYGYKFIDDGRLRACSVVEDGGRRELYTRDALVALRELLRTCEGPRTAYLVSGQATNEELFAARKLFRDALGVRCWLPETGVHTGDGDDFLIHPDKHPNIRGARAIFGLAEGDLLPEDQMAARVKAEQIGLLLVNRHDLDESTLAELRALDCRIVFLGTNENRTSAAAALSLALAVFAEQEGTFTNFEGRVQRIHLAVPPAGQSEPEWALLDKLAQQLGLNLSFTSPGQIFGLLRREVPAFGVLDYHDIPPTGGLIRHE